jgi:hypothetical protein
LGNFLDSRQATTALPNENLKLPPSGSGKWKLNKWGLRPYFLPRYARIPFRHRCFALAFAVSEAVVTVEAVVSDRQTATISKHVGI